MMYNHLDVYCQDYKYYNQYIKGWQYLKRQNVILRIQNVERNGEQMHAELFIRMSYILHILCIW